MISFENNTISEVLIDKIKAHENIVWVEIGVYKGKSAENVLENLDIKKICLIDPYTPLPYHERYFGTEELVNDSKEIAHDRLKKYEDKCIWYEDFSENVVDKFNDESIDIIYIDGNHSYESVLCDLNNYYPKVKKGGLIIGDDYHENEVKEAIFDFTKKLDITYNTSTNKLKCNIVNKFWLIK